MFYRLEKKTSKNLTYIERNTAVSPTGFHDRDGQQYCQQCFLTLFASRCQGCSQPILENYISALNSLWHPQCFVCRVSVSLDISVIASAASGKRADKEQKKKKRLEPFVCTQQILFRFDRSASVRELEEVSQGAFEGEGHVIYSILASHLSPPRKTHSFAGFFLLDQCKRHFIRYHLSCVWPFDVQTVSPTYTTKQSDIM